MNVKELRQLLEDVPDDMLVIVQKDGEGNGYSPLDSVYTENNSYVSESSYGGEVKLTKLTSYMKDCGFTKQDVAPKDAEPCIVLIPVN